MRVLPKSITANGSAHPILATTRLSAGRIPGATHLPYQEFLNEDDTFKEPKELQTISSRVGLDLEGDRRLLFIVG